MKPRPGPLHGEGRAPGSVLIGLAAWLLIALAGGLLFVSFAAQYAYLLAARHQAGPAAVAALALDAGMIIFSLLALGLARAGKSARTERVLILACAAGSAGMNYLAADVTSPRSVAAFVVWPLFLAVVTDRVVAVVRRHVLGDDEESSPWVTAGRAALYLLRLVLAPPSTAKGLRQMALDAAPLPGHAEPEASGSCRPERPPLARELPDSAAADDSTARVRGLTAARSDTERALAQALIRSGGPLPGRNELARVSELAPLGSEATRRRAATRILADVKAGLNGRSGGSTS